MIVAVPKEIIPGERRVALTPATVKKLTDRGLEVAIEAGAGAGAQIPDRAFEDKGARVASSVEELLGGADVVVKVRPPVFRGFEQKHEVDMMREGAALVSLLFPSTDHDLVRKLTARRISAFALELMPRITRAQSMDVLSSMSSVAGYEAVLHAASIMPRFLPMMMTAAGTITPARILILGAGVAGLQAIATARRLGAVVEAYDIRPIVKEQVESLGAKFLSLELDTSDAQDSGGYAKQQTDEDRARQQEQLKSQLRRFDAVLTTALVPGRRAPILLTADMVTELKPGSVVVDLAAEQGGNCELTEPGETKEVDGVTISGPLDLVSRLPLHASEMFSNNLANYLRELVPEKEIDFNMENELVSAPLVTRDGEIVHEATRAALSGEAET